MERDAVERWVAGYEKAWRTAGTAGLNALFAPDVHYSTSPWATPIVRLDALARFWEAGRAGPDEAFSMTSDVVAVDADTAVVRLSVEYELDPPVRWRDLWVLRFDTNGLCARFEEWPFAPGQPDGQEPGGSD